MIQIVSAINIVLGLIGFSWLLLRTLNRRDEYPDEVLLLLYATIALFFGLLTSSVAIYVAGGTVWNTGIIGATKVFVLYVLWTTRTTKYRTGTRQKDGNPGAQQNKNIA